ncbi:hypothetical protein [Caballeronia telluris]|uniref:Uncharacterized protein n=1 Tax=Caballeronia telluris TaxID=326475 RepID=A0A158FJ46_9BURK|nr:hypothetical protein [Caballeronia telluris]SAL19785.1 hypothetical protein AWB66_00966 [Caballeronia telluris]
MPQTDVIYRLPRSASLLKGLGIVAGVTAVSIAAALCCEQYRKRELIRSLASMPGAASILPALHTNAEMLLAALGRPMPPAPGNDKP